MVWTTLPALRAPQSLGRVKQFSRRSFERVPLLPQTEDRLECRTHAYVLVGSRLQACSVAGLARGQVRLRFAGMASRNGPFPFPGWLLEHTLVMQLQFRHNQSSCSYSSSARYHVLVPPPDLFTRAFSPHLASVVLHTGISHPPGHQSGRR